MTPKARRARRMRVVHSVGLLVTLGLLAGSVVFNVVTANSDPNASALLTVFAGVLGAGIWGAATVVADEWDNH